MKKAVESMGPSGEGGDARVVECWTLICRRDLKAGRICLGSLSAALEGRVRFSILEDGSLSDEEAAWLESEFPGSRVVRRKEADERMASVLGRYPDSLKYRSEHVFGLKLLDIPWLAGEGDRIRYIDSDVLFLRKTTDPFASPDGCPVFFGDDDHGYAGRFWKMKWGYRWRVPAGLNAGFLSFPRRLYDPEFIEWFLKEEEFRRVPWCREQTCWAIMARDAAPRVLSPEQVYCSCRRPPEIGTGWVVLHLMGRLKRHAEGLEEIMRQWRELHPRAELRTVAAGEIGALEVVGRPLVRLRRRWLEDTGWWPRAG